MMMQMYRVGEFAAMTGVSIRTLHHYDRIGLLRPSTRSEAGYRLYTQQDLLCLQQILTLRYLGMPLSQIRALLERPDFDLLVSLRIQQAALRDRIADLERTDAALQALVDHRLHTGQWSWDLMAQTASAVHRHIVKGDDTMEQYYTPEHIRRQFDELAAGVPAEEIAAVEQGWMGLLTDVQAARQQGLDPASPEAQALLERWDALSAGTMRHFAGNPDLGEWIAEGYRTDRYQHVPGAPGKEDFAFIEGIREARSR